VRAAGTARVNPTTHTLHPKLQPLTLNLKTPTLNPQPSTLNPQPLTLHPNHRFPGLLVGDVFFRRYLVMFDLQV